jgi:hypothetical protein
VPIVLGHLVPEIPVFDVAHGFSDRVRDLVAQDARPVSVVRPATFDDWVRPEYLLDVTASPEANQKRVHQVVRLALLAPDIVEAILAGKQPASLTLKDLMLPFPVEWAGQRARFGVGATQ